MDSFKDMVLQAGGTVREVDAVDLKSYVNEYSTDYEMRFEVFRSVDDPKAALTFMTDYQEDGTPYCTVYADSEEWDHKILLSEGENGYTIGHVNDIKAFMNEHMEGGFYQESEVKITPEMEKLIYDEAFIADIDYGVIPDDEEMDFSVELDPEKDPVPTEMPSPTEELAAEMKEILSLPLEEQAERFGEIIKQDGLLDQALKEMPEQKEVTAEERFAYDGTDRELSEETKSFFQVTEETKPLFDVLQKGFVPYEMREGYVDKEGNPGKHTLTAEIVKEVRDKFDPGFAKVMGVDTTQYHLNGPDKNISIIPLSYEDIKDHACATHFKPEDVESVRAIKEYGHSIDVRGTEVGVINLVTIEVSVKNDDQIHRSTVVMDDLGMVRGDLSAVSGGTEFLMRGNNPDVHKLSDIHIEKLDRSNMDNPAHFKVLDGKDISFREAFVEELKERIPDVIAERVESIDLSHRPNDEMEIGRKDYLEMNLSDAKSVLAQLHPVKNFVGLYKEHLVGKAERANSFCATTTNDISRTLIENRDLDPDSKEYKDMMEKVNGMKEEVLHTYKEYVECRNHANDFSEKAEAAEDAYHKASMRVQGLEHEYSALFEDRPTSFQMDSYKSTELKPLTAEQRFENLCGIEKHRTTLLPMTKEDSFKHITENNQDVIKEAYEGVMDIIREYNDSVEMEEEKIFTIYDKEMEETPDNTSGIYTDAGYAIESGSQIEFDPTDVYDREKMIDMYSKQADFEHIRVTNAGGEGLKMSGPIRNSMRAISYGKESAKDCPRSHMEIRTDFLKNNIRCGFDKPRIGDYVSTTIGIGDREHIQQELDGFMEAASSHKEVGTLDYDALREEGKEIEEELLNKEPVEIEFPENDTVEEPEQTDTTSKEEPEHSLNSGRSMHSAFGKVDGTKGVDISKEKMEELKKESELEAMDTGRDKEEILKEKVSDLKEKLEGVKSDILHYKDKMSAYEEVPMRYLSKHTGFANSKLEYDSAVHVYQKLGGKVGTDSFIIRGVKDGELFLSRMDFLHSDLPTTMVLDSILQVDTKEGISSIFKDSEGNAVRKYSDLSNFLEKHSGLFHNISSPFAGITKRVMSKDWASKIISEINKEFKEFKEYADSKMEKNEMEQPSKEEMEDVQKPEDQIIEEQPMEMPEAEMQSDIHMDVSDDPIEPENESDAVEREERLEDTPVDVKEEKEKEIEEEKDKLIEKAEDMKEMEKPEEENQDKLSDTEKPEEQHMEKNEQKDNAETKDTEKQEDKDTEKSENTDTDKTESKDVEQEKAEKDENQEIAKEESDLEKEIENNVEPEQDTEKDMVRPEDDTKVESSENKEPETQEDNKPDNSNEVEESEEAKEKEDVASVSEETMEERAASVEQTEDIEDGEEESVTRSDIEQEETVQEDVEERDFEDVLQDVLDGKEDMHTYADSLSDYLSDENVDKGQLMDTLADHFSEHLTENPEAVTEVGDVIYETADMIDGAHSENAYQMLEGIEERGVPTELCHSVEEQVADNFDTLNDLFEPDEYGTFDEFEITDSGFFDMASGMEVKMEDFADRNMEPMEFEVENVFDMETLEATADLPSLDASMELYENPEFMDLDTSIREQAIGDAFDQMSMDYANGQDIFTPDYQNDLASNIFEQAQTMPQEQFIEAKPQDFLPEELPMEQGAELVEGAEGAEAMEVIGALLV